MLKLIDIFPDWATNGIFKYIETTNIPWSTPLATQLDAEYFGNISGDKNISPLVEKMLNRDNELENSSRTALASIIRTMFSTNWEKEYATMSAIYNPIENYSMTEQMTNDITRMDYGRSTTRTNNLTHAKTGTENISISKTGTETDVPNLTDVTDNDVYGFNSATAVPTGKQTQSSTGTQTRTYNVSEPHNTTYNTSDTDTGTITDANIGSDTHTRNYTLSRSGNIGVTTSQQMLQSERDLWVWNYFINVIFPDVDKVLTINIY